MSCICPVCDTVFPLSRSEVNTRSGMVRCTHCRNVFAAEPNRFEPNLADVDETPTQIGNGDAVLPAIGHPFNKPVFQNEEEKVEGLEEKDPLSDLYSDEFVNETEPFQESPPPTSRPLQLDAAQSDNGHEQGEPARQWDQDSIDDLNEKFDEIDDYLGRHEPKSEVIAEPKIELLDLNVNQSIGVNPPKPRTAYDSGLEFVVDDLHQLDGRSDDVGMVIEPTSERYLPPSNGNEKPVNKKSRFKLGREKKKPKPQGVYEQTSLGRMRTNGVDEYISKKNNPLGTLIWSLVAIGFVFLLGLQVKYYFVEEYEQHESYRKYLVAFCKVARCELSPRREPYSFTLTHTKIDLHPSNPGSLRVTVKMVNEAQFAQPYPDLQLTLTDRVGRVVGRRVYPSDLYLPTGQKNLIDPGSLKEVVFDLLRPHEKAVGFVVAVSISATPA